ncbi:5-formyltetrahydrofolate cyclo-ligase [Gottschalkia purinilytica]|uniref:5-formyltetrahydrofolate cyclo-ligase n=1 Tax=Gottschalkia purinilytica TaxID=1503 RepID=A0A0L0WCH5_GOTPU|nr:5-formyltetrahydrofolate cyclo-ligase [Gottschalkia purinilytica]KNF09167.1 5-formyltetrahydrofolate cyclo-ligase [Gottschalkia purinilytica]
MDKNTLRKEILSQRKAMSLEEVNKKSDQVTDLLLSSEYYKNAKNIMAYIDFRNEVKTERLIKTALKDKKNIIIPISVVETRQLILSQLLDYDNELESGTYGILEPKKEFIREVEPSCIDLVLIPGVAFDRRGFRIGYGAGYYDRFLEKVDKSAPKIALSFELQMVSNAFEGPHDFPVDSIITENEVIICKR